MDAWEFHIILSEVRHLYSLFGLRIVCEDIHDTVTVGKEKDFIANPHRKNVLSYIIGYILHCFVSRIIHPDVIGHTAFIILPSTKFAHHPVVCQLFSVR